MMEKSALTVVVLYVLEAIVVLPILIYAVWTIYRKYLIKQIQMGSFSGSFIPFQEQAIVDLLKNGAISECPEVSAYNLRLLEELNIKNFDIDLISALDNPRDEVKEYAITRINELKIKTATPKLLNLAKNKNQSERIRSFSASAYCTLAGKEAYKELPDLLSDESKMGTIIGLLRVNNIDAYFIAMGKIYEMMNSDDENERAKVAEIIGYIGKDKGSFTYPLTLLATDDSKKVKKQVILALERTKSSVMVDYLVRRLVEVEFKKDAFNALVAIGGEVVSPLCNMIINDKENTNVLVYLVEIIGLIMGLEGKEALLTCLAKSKNRRVKEAVLKALEKNSLVIEKSYINNINNMISEETKNIVWLYACIIDISADEEGLKMPFIDNLLDALRKDIVDTKIRILALCNLTLVVKEKVSFTNIFEKEHFDILKANDIKFKKVDIFRDLPESIILGRIDKDFKKKSKSARERIKEIIVSDFLKSTKWVRACACYTALCLGGRDFLESFVLAKEDKSQMVREIAIYALKKIKEGNYASNN